MNICSKNERKTIDYFLKTKNVGRMVIASIVTVLIYILMLPIMIPVVIVRTITTLRLFNQILKAGKELDRIGMFDKFHYDDLVVIVESITFFYTKKLYDMIMKFDLIWMFPTKLIYKDYWKYIKRQTFINIYDGIEEIVCKPIFTVH